MIVGDRASECALVPSGCSIVVLHDKDKHFNSDYISIDIMKEISRNVQKTSQWSGPISMLSGCHVRAIKTINNKKSFSFYSFYEATDLNDKEKTKVDIQKCKNDKFNPFFNEIVKSFSPIKQ